MRELHAIQRRFYDAVTGRAAPDDLGLVTRADRLAIYARMYVDRLHDVLCDDYPKLVTALGAEAFRGLVVEFLGARPPASFTVRDAGAALPDYLATRADLPPWAPDLARLERARVEVFDAADAAPLARDDLSALEAADWAAFELAWIPASTIVHLRWTADELWSAIEDEAPLPTPARAPRVVLVWRRGTLVIHRTLEPDEAAVADGLRGTTIEVLCERLAGVEAPAPAERAVELLTRWLDAEALAHS